MSNETSPVLPKSLRRLPHAELFELVPKDRPWDCTDVVASSPTTFRRLGPTVWYRFGGTRQIMLRRHADRFLVQECFMVRGSTYVRTIHQGNDLYEAVKAANDKFNAFADETGHRSHETYCVGIQCWFGFDCWWDKDPFDADRIIDSMRSAAKFQARREREARERRQFAIEHGLVSA